MATQNTAQSYGSVTKTFHWLTALLILTVIPLGIIANGMAYDTGEALARKAWLFSLHKTIGITIFFVALARIAWALNQPKPNGLHPENKLESFMAELVHWLLYGSLLLVPLTGWVHHAATTGFAPIWWPFGQTLPFVPKSDALAGTTAGLHLVLERVLVVSLALHIAGALKHVIIDRDGTLRRMLPRGGAVPTPAERDAKSLAPMAGAVVIWLAAVGIGSAMGLYGSHSGPGVETTELDAVASEWAVQDGQIEIVVMQFGSGVTGHFADWTSQISFTPDDTVGVRGAVRTVVSIGSLTLGSVTEQAMGPDFFDAQTHPTAIFEGDIVNLGDGYAAQGKLSLKGAAIPVTLPFTLTLEDNTARMEGSVLLNRLDFGIGANMPDESSLGFAVEVRIALTALRGGET